MDPSISQIYLKIIILYIYKKKKNKLKICLKNRMISNFPIFKTNEQI